MNSKKYYNQETGSWEHLFSTEGRSAYDAACQEGYTGSEKEFNEALSKIAEVVESLGSIKDLVNIINNIDNIPTEDSENLVKSGGVHNALKTIEGKVDDKITEVSNELKKVNDSVAKITIPDLEIVSTGTGVINDISVDSSNKHKLNISKQEIDAYTKKEIDSKFENLNETVGDIVIPDIKINLTGNGNVITSITTNSNNKHTLDVVKGETAATKDELNNYYTKNEVNDKLSQAGAGNVTSDTLTEDSIVFASGENSITTDESYNKEFLDSLAKRDEIDNLIGQYLAGDDSIKEIITKTIQEYIKSGQGNLGNVIANSDLTSGKLVIGDGNKNVAVSDIEATDIVTKNEFDNTDGDIVTKIKNAVYQYISERIIIPENLITAENPLTSGDVVFATSSYGVESDGTYNREFFDSLAKKSDIAESVKEYFDSNEELKNTIEQYIQEYIGSGEFEFGNVSADGALTSGNIIIGKGDFGVGDSNVNLSALATKEDIKEFVTTGDLSNQINDLTSGFVKKRSDLSTGKIVIARSADTVETSGHVISDFILSEKLGQENTTNNSSDGYMSSEVYLDDKLKVGIPLCEDGHDGFAFARKNSSAGNYPTSETSIVLPLTSTNDNYGYVELKNSDLSNVVSDAVGSNEKINDLETKYNEVKTKVDGFNEYTLPTADHNILGGIKTTIRSNTADDIQEAGFNKINNRVALVGTVVKDSKLYSVLPIIQREEHETQSANGYVAGQYCMLYSNESDIKIDTSSFKSEDPSLVIVVKGTTPINISNGTPSDGKLLIIDNMLNAGSTAES